MTRERRRPAQEPAPAPVWGLAPTPERRALERPALERPAAAPEQRALERPAAAPERPAQALERPAKALEPERPASGWELQQRAATVTRAQAPVTPRAPAWTPSRA